MGMKPKNTRTSAAAEDALKRANRFDVSKDMTVKRKPASKPKPATIPAIRLKPGTWVAMDRQGEFYGYLREPRPLERVWTAEGVNVFLCRVFVGLPRIPKSQWNKHLFRVGRSGELIRVEVK